MRLGRLIIVENLVCEVRPQRRIAQQVAAPQSSILLARWCGSTGDESTSCGV